MKERQKRIDSMHKDLVDIYQDLFGQKYIPGLQQNQKSQFSFIITQFKTQIHAIKQAQQQRTTKEKKKNYSNTTQAIRKNAQIRDNIKNAQQILKQAVRRMKTDNLPSSKDSAQITRVNKINAMRQKDIANCYDQLQDVKQIQQGGVYQPPPSHPTLTQMKKNLFKDSPDELPIDQVTENAIDQAKRVDNQIEDMLDEVIDVNGRVIRKLRTANEAIDQRNALIDKAGGQMDVVQNQVNKANQDLAQVLKHYRRPNKLCLDITLVFLVIALIGVIINMMRSKT